MQKLILALLLTLCGCNNMSLHTAFLSPVCIKPYKNYQYHVCSDIEFIINKEKFTIPKGFETDLASIPRVIWPLMSPAHSALIRPSIVHDWFYRKTCDFNRKQIDLIFYHMLINDGISKVNANAMYYAVRSFGWKAYKEDYCE